METFFHLFLMSSAVQSWLSKENWNENSTFFFFCLVKLIWIEQRLKMKVFLITRLLLEHQKNCVFFMFNCVSFIYFVCALLLNEYIWLVKKQIQLFKSLTVCLQLFILFVIIAMLLFVSCQLIIHHLFDFEASLNSIKIWTKKCD